MESLYWPDLCKQYTLLAQNVDVECVYVEFHAVMTFI